MGKMAKLVSGAHSDLGPAQKDSSVVLVTLKLGSPLVGVESKDTIKSKIGKRKDLFPAASREHWGSLPNSKTEEVLS